MKKWLEQFFRCPDCQQGGLEITEKAIFCGHCGASFPVARRAPALLSHGNEVFPLYLYEGLIEEKHPSIFPFLPGPSVNLTRPGNLRTFAGVLRSFNPARVLVVGCGGEKEQLNRFFAPYKHIRLVCCDVDRQADVDLFCDAHQLPFKDGSFHGIITTAVLEHVLYPEVVAGELTRVLTEGGVLYSEAPLIQQVHGGAYDFTRLTLSGHRRLFNSFRELSVGMVAGPGTALVWSLEHFFMAFARCKGLRQFIKGLTRGAFCWLKYFDYLFAKNPKALDGASCTFFLGTKATGYQRRDQDIIRSYR